MEEAEHRNSGLTGFGYLLKVPLELHIGRKHNAKKEPRAISIETRPKFILNDQIIYFIASTIISYTNIYTDLK